MPRELFHVSKNGLVIPRFISISIPTISVTLVSIILILLVLLLSTTMREFRGARIILPLSENAQFQFSYIDQTDTDNFLLVARMWRNTKVVIPGASIDDPDSLALPYELSRLYREKADWIKHLQVPFLQKSHLFNMGYIGSNQNKMFLEIDSEAPWGEVVSMLKAAQMAGICEICFLTENF